MAPNKLETQIREKLNSREIKPTEMAWDRLDAMLTVAEEKKTKRSFGWLYIAASILVFLSVGIYFFNQNDIEVNPENSVVVKEGENINNRSNDNHNGNVPSIINKQENQENQVALNPQPATHNPQQSSKSFNQINQKTTINPNQENLSNNQEVIAENSIPKIKIEEKLAQVKPQVDDIDALLALASKSVKEKNQKSDVKIKISSSALLAQVDGAVETTFREKVLKKVVKNYEEIKVAVTTRNVINENNAIKNNYK